MFNPNPFRSESTTANPIASALRPIVHVQAVIKKVERDGHHDHVLHHHLLIHQIQVMDTQEASPSLVAEEVFCAIRYGDAEGLGEPILGLEPGKPIELQGEYIDEQDAYASHGNPGDPVLHKTHHPFGFVQYEGKRYE